MRYNLYLSLSAAALALAGCGAKTEANTTSTDTSVTAMTTNEGTDAGVNTDAAAMPSAGQGFANTAAASDAFEIATSQLAATNAKSAAVKAFAAKMIAAHTESTAKLEAAAGKASPAITPDPALTADQQQKVDSLKILTGDDFDKAYAAAQVDAHQQTLDGVKAYAATGDVPSLKAFADGLIPTVTGHLEMARKLNP